MSESQTKGDDANKPTLRRNPNSNTPIEDETDPSKKPQDSDEDRPKLKRRPTDTGDSGSQNNPKN